jgi:biotin transport system substrate-specific component
MHSPRFSIRGITFSALFGALLVVSSYFNIHFGFTPVPISLENFAIMIAGAFLGASYGFFSIAMVVALTAIGLPLLHGAGGLPLLLGPTGGYIWMYPLSALLIGWCVSRVKDSGIGAFALTFAAMAVFGSLLLYVTGVPWLAHKLNKPLDVALTLGCYPYLPGDMIKAFVAALAVNRIRAYVPVGKLIRGGDAVVRFDT